MGDMLSLARFLNELCDCLPSCMKALKTIKSRQIHHLLPLLELPLSAGGFESTGLEVKWEYAALVSSWYDKPVCSVSWDFPTLLTQDLPLQIYLELRAIVPSSLSMRATEVPAAAHEHK